MEQFFELVESVVFRVDAAGTITPLNKAATSLLGERPADARSLPALFGESSHEGLCAAAGSARTCNVGATRIQWEILAPQGAAGDVLAVGVNWKPASEFVDQMTKETLIFKELVMNLVPRFIVDAMMERKAVQPKAYRESTIVFVDAIGFADLAAELDPVSLLRRLDHYFSKFDQASSHFGLEKLKTIGDSYMAVSGIPHRKPSHAVDAVLCGLEIMSVVRQASTKHSSVGGVLLDFRVGMHSGPIISGVLGSSKYMFDIWGEAVSVAAAVEKAAAPGSVTVSEATLGHTHGLFETRPRAALDHRNTTVPLFEVVRLLPAYSDDGLTPNARFRTRYAELFLGSSAPPSMKPPPYFTGE